MHNIGEILPHAVLYRSTLRLSSVILSQHMSRHKPWCPEMCPRVASIGKCRAPRVNDDTLSARHCVTECIYSIYPGTKVWGSSAGPAAGDGQPAAQSRRYSSRDFSPGFRRFAPTSPCRKGFTQSLRFFVHPLSFQEGPCKKVD